jgi:succinate dehydrogenase flavin-adding protein (antitoxin of CptAB toxin-antitoxin module)
MEIIQRTFNRCVIKIINELKQHFDVKHVTHVELTKTSEYLLSHLNDKNHQFSTAIENCKEEIKDHKLSCLDKDNNDLFSIIFDNNNLNSRKIFTHISNTTTEAKSQNIFNTIFTDLNLLMKYDIILSMVENQALNSLVNAQISNNSQDVKQRLLECDSNDFVTLFNGLQSIYDASNETERQDIRTNLSNVQEEEEEENLQPNS